MGIYEVKDVQRTPHGLQILIVWAASDRASNLSCKASLVLRIDLFYLPSCNGLNDPRGKQFISYPLSSLSSLDLLKPPERWGEVSVSFIVQVYRMQFA